MWIRVRILVFSVLMSAGFFLGGALPAHAAALTSTNVQPASLVANASSTVTVSFTTATNLPNDGKIKVTFGANFNVGTIGVPVNCTGLSAGGFSVGTAGNVVTLTMNGAGSTTNAPAAISCTFPTITNPSFAGSTGTYSIETTTAGDVQLDVDAAVAADTIIAGTLTSTNVQPASTMISTTNVVTVSFTTTISLANNGKVKITFPSGYDVSAATGGACTSMDGTFTTGVSGQVVTLTRSGGSSEGAGAQTCTVNNVRNPATAGTTGTYTISTTNSSDAVHDTDAAVTGDLMTSSAEDDSSSSSADTYAIEVTVPGASDAYIPGDDVEITWNTSGGSASAGFVSLYYSVDGGTTLVTIEENTVNDSTYNWTVPDITEQSVIIYAESTDLLDVLASDESGAFSINGNAAPAEDAEDVDTSEDSEELLPDGTYMKGESWSTVYYVHDGMRHPFLDSQTFFTYADDFDDVVEVEDGYLANYTIGTPMLPKAGTVLVKIQSVNNVYVLEADNTLRWITSEDLAEELYGNDWADYVIDVPVTAWGHFNHGDDIDSASEVEVDLDSMKTRYALNVR